MSRADALTKAFRVQTVAEATHETMNELAMLCMPKLHEDLHATLAQSLDLAEGAINEGKQLRSHLTLALETITALLDHVDIDLYGQVRVSAQYGSLRQMARRVVEIFALAPPAKAEETDHA
jgi:hypothetical protein